MALNVVALLPPNFEGNNPTGREVPRAMRHEEKARQDAEHAQHLR